MSEDQHLQSTLARSLIWICTLCSVLCKLYSCSMPIMPFSSPSWDITRFNQISLAPLCQDTPPVSIPPLFPAFRHSLSAGIIGGFTVKVRKYFAIRCNMRLFILGQKGYLVTSLMLLFSGCSRLVVAQKESQRLQAGDWSTGNSFPGFNDPWVNLCKARKTKRRRS